MLRHGTSTFSRVSWARISKAASSRTISESRRSRRVGSSGAPRRLGGWIPRAGGRVCLPPASDVSLLAWTGAGFVAWDRETGESAYILSGNLAGSSTAEPPENNPDLQQTLSDPEESKDEPSRIVAGMRHV